MGMYDTITFKCPHCGKELSTQSKGGDCTLAEYEHTDVPIDVANDANRHTPVKCICGKSWYFDESVIPTIPMRINLPIREL